MSDSEPPSYICTECGYRVYTVEPTEPRMCGYCQTKPGWHNKLEKKEEDERTC
jgi:ribosomal protein L37E